MRTYLHIGAEKTGTSSLQQFFRLNRNLLKQTSTLYSEVAGAESHMALSAAAQHEQKYDDLRIIYQLDTPTKVREFRKSLTQRLMTEAEESNCSQLVLSSEHCSSRLNSVVEVETLARILRPVSNDIRVIVYIRRQDDFLCSTYSTDVKSGFTGPMTLPSADIRKSRYDYHELLQRWSSVFGKDNTVCRIYDSKRLKGGDVVADFIELIGLTLPPDYVNPPRVNESLDVTALEFLRMFNKTVPRFKDNRKNPGRGNIVQLLKKVSQGANPALSGEQLEEFMRFFHHSNAMVAEEYFGTFSTIGDPLFGETGGSKNRAEMQPISAEKAVMLAALLWEQKQEQLLKQAERIAHLQKKRTKAVPVFAE